jgi:hypothetical protein
MVTNLGNSSLPATAFWTFGQPFQPGEVPSGSIVSANLNGIPVPIGAGAQKYHADGSLAWAQITADFSGISLLAGVGQTLTFIIGGGSWSNSTTRTNSDWSALLDTVELTNLSTTSTSNPDMDGAGTWTATFDAGGTNTIETYSSSPRGIYVSVKAQIKNGSTVHAYLVARMEYLVCQKADTSLGPIASRGPFIENIQMLKSNAESLNNPGQFTYDLNWKRNGVSQRSQLQVPHIAGSFACMPRYDGLWDWNTADPQIGITQDYNLTRKTKKTPPFLTGVSYTGSSSSLPNNPITGIDTITGIFTISTVYNIFGIQKGPISVGFTASVMPTGLSADPTIYWASYVSNSTFAVYDTYAHALAGGSTGKVIPSTSGTSVLVRPSIAPMNPASYQQYMPSSGGRFDLSWYSEWGTAYHFGNTPEFQRLARVMAHAYAGVPIMVLNDVTGKIPNFSNTSIAGLGSTLTTTWWTTGPGQLSSSNLGGGTFATGGVNGWFPDGAHEPGAVHYAVWVMEGGTVLRDLIMLMGARAIGTTPYQPQRNLVISGTTYYCSVCFTWAGATARAGAWNLREIVHGAFVAPNGGPEETYFRQVLSDNCSEFAAYQAYKGGNYSALGVIYYDETDYPPQTHQVGWPMMSGFMQSYMGFATSMAAILQGDFVSGLNTIATYNAKWNVGLYTSSFPAYYATAYSMSYCLSDSNVGASPGAYVSTPAQIGLGGDNMIFDYVSGSSTITFDGASALPPWTIAVGDTFRPFNYYCYDTSAPRNISPSPYVDGTNYVVTGIGSGNFTVGVTAGATVIDCGGYFLPTGQPNPGSGTLSGDQNSPDGYLAYHIAGLGVQSVFGATNASTAYTNALGRFTGTAGYAQESQWAFQNSV